MRNSLACLAAALLLLQPAAHMAQLSGAQYRNAVPGYRYEFPRDHFDHPDFQTEWWYYTGNVKAADGHRFGFELTFFRQAVNRDPAKTKPWDVRDDGAGKAARKRSAILQEALSYGEEQKQCDSGMDPITSIHLAPHY